MITILVTILIVGILFFTVCTMDDNYAKFGCLCFGLLIACFIIIPIAYFELGDYEITRKPHNRNMEIHNNININNR